VVTTNGCGCANPAERENYPKYTGLYIDRFIFDTFIYRRSPVYTYISQPILPKKHVNLTNGCVYACMDAHPDISQEKTVDHFRNRPEGGLIFNQSMLSRKVEARAGINKHPISYPNALSQNHVRFMTRPGVDSALLCWVGGIGAKQEIMTGANCAMPVPL